MFSVQHSRTLKKINKSTLFHEGLHLTVKPMNLNSGSNFHLEMLEKKVEYLEKNLSRSKDKNKQT